nr:unnamed protein product [Spirometra erinaceieuropaei]
MFEKLVYRTQMGCLSSLANAPLAESGLLNFILTPGSVALFSSIPHNLAIESVARRLEETPIGIPTEHVLDMLGLCLKNYCQFDGKYYQQVKGTPMGSPISGLLAELVLQRLEEVVIQAIRPKMWLRYVDDTFVVIKNCEVERLHQSLNGVFSAIQFTREEATGDILPFLDVSVQRLTDGNLATSVHRKDSSAEIILNYGSEDVLLANGLPTECGKRPAPLKAPRDYNGKKIEATPNSWPWHVGLFSSAYGPYPFCGGTLISPTWVLTAAHCAVPAHLCVDAPRGQPFQYQDFSDDELVVRIGDHNHTRRGRPAYSVRVQHIIIHPKYPKDGPSKGYDLALLKLTRTVRRSNVAEFACLPEAGFEVPVGDFCYLAGWGLIPPRKPGWKQPDVLMEIRTPIVSSSKCKKKHIYVDKSLHVCTDTACGVSTNST